MLREVQNYNIFIQNLFFIFYTTFYFYRWIFKIINT